MRRAFGDGDVDARAHRRPEAGDLRVPRRRRLRLPRGRAGGRRRARRSTSTGAATRALIDAYDALFGGARLGHEGIVYRHVRGGAGQPRRRGCDGAPESAPLRIRVVHRDDPASSARAAASCATPSAREHIARDLAADLVGLLASGAEIEVRDEAGETLRTEPVRPGHVAVLVRTHRNAALVRDALDDAGIPAVINGAGSVFGTTPARDWLRLLEALERPSSRAAGARRRADAVPRLDGARSSPPPTRRRWRSCTGGCTPGRGCCARAGVAALAETVTLVEGLPERVLRTHDGERRLTDLRHVGQLLHAAATAEHAGVTALTALAAPADRRRRRRHQRRGAQPPPGVRRRGRPGADDPPQQGPRVPDRLFPYLWEPGYIPRDPQPIFFHDPDAAATSATSTSAWAAPTSPAHRRQHEAEQRGEDLRLAYVALTRARHQAVVWWAGSWDSRQLRARAAAVRRAATTAPCRRTATPRRRDAAATARFEELAAQAPGCISVEHAGARAAHVTWSGAQPHAEDLVVARFDRTLDRGWRRTSYSDITAGAARGARGERAGGDARHRRGRRRRPAAGRRGRRRRGRAARASRRCSPACRPASHVGTFVHRVFEATDFAAPDLDAELGRRIDEVLARRARGPRRPRRRARRAAVR